MQGNGKKRWWLTLPLLARLRREIASLRHGLSAATSEANRYTADSALDVFGECVERYQVVAKAADRHANDAVTLDQAWPVSD
ncbi:hypothetical protein [Laribacter hongkongensis]|uniref:hypothetical protein n=1 Tax=Laribacter hongkongensis TaxID=168471 RepID=UPI001EFCB704|nr:hypothetical protein [Laribacter hongkongensis]MCG9083858.1 hypothetical protein [Laribacter hongkongensis]